MAPTICWINRSKDLKFVAPSVTPSAARKLLSEDDETPAAEFWAVFKKERLSNLDKTATARMHHWRAARSKRASRYDSESDKDLARSSTWIPSDQTWRTRWAHEEKIQTRDAGLQAYYDACSVLEAGVNEAAPHPSDVFYPIRASKRLRRPRAVADVREDAKDWTLVPRTGHEEVFGLGDEGDAQDDNWVLLHET